MKQEINQKYIDQANAPEVEFFDIVDEGLPNQHRVLKEGKTIEGFNQRHGEIWHNHEDELIASGLMKPRPEPEPVRDAFAEIDKINEKLDLLLKKK